MNKLRELPSVDKLLQEAAHLIELYGRPLTVDALRLTLDEVRGRFQSDRESAPPTLDLLLTQAESHLTAWTNSSLVQVINATGVILHTNLGRAPLSPATIKAMGDAATGYTNLEYDLPSGKRGSRLIHAEKIIQKLTGAESALVVNNNASAVLLVLSALAARKKVVIARSQLVEIGGGFRVPDVMKQSGAKLLEVGTTNKVNLRDYQAAIEEKPALVMRAHRSNFKIVGFTEEPALKDILDVAHKNNIPVVDDLGSGALVDTTRFGIAHEPTVQESLEAGVDVVCFSGDKLLGGPQSGIILGRKDLLDKVKKHPLARAVRADKTCLAGLSATLTHYLRDEAEKEIPILRMMSLSPDQVRSRAEAWQKSFGQGKVIASKSTVGGGSLPEESMDTYVLSLDIRSPNKFLKQLRDSNPPVIARTENDRVLLDPRTVLDDASLIDAVKNVLL